MNDSSANPGRLIPASCAPAACAMARSSQRFRRLPGIQRQRSQGPGDVEAGAPLADVCRAPVAVRRAEKVGAILQRAATQDAVAPCHVGLGPSSSLVCVVRIADGSASLLDDGPAFALRFGQAVRAGIGIAVLVAVLHPSATLPCMSYSPKALARNEPTGALCRLSHWLPQMSLGQRPAQIVAHAYRLVVPALAAYSHSASVSRR